MPGLRAVIILFVALFSFSPLQAQPLSGGGDDQGGTKPGLFADIMDAIDSGSRMLITQIQPEEQRDLIENPRFNSQESPRDSLMTLLNAMTLVERGYEDIGYQRALASLPDGTTREDARTLYRILLRIGPVSAAELPGPKQAEKAGDARYEFFPRGMDHEWLWARTKVPPGAEIALVRQGEGTWLFSQQSVDGADELLEAVADLPPVYGRNDGGQYFLRVFSPMVSQTGIVGWIGFLGLTIFGVAAGIAVSRALRWVAARLADRERTYLAQTLRGLGKSGGIVLFTIIFTIAIGFIELGPVLQPLRYIIPRFLIIIAVALFIISLIDVVAAMLTARERDNGSNYNLMVVTAVRRILRVFVISLILVFIMQNMLGMNIGALLVGFGFIALALSLAAQDTVKNLFGAVSIFVNRPFVVGDWIIFRGEMGEHIGVVRDIELQSTKVEDLEGNLVTLPNMLFIDREVQNLSARGHIRRKVDIAIPYRADTQELDRAMEALNDVFQSDDVLEDAGAKDRDGEPHVSFFGFADSWLTIRGYHYYYMGETGETQRDTERGWFSFLSHCSLVNRKIVEMFGERDIEFAFPTQTVALVPQEGDPIAIRQQSGDQGEKGQTSGKKEAAQEDGGTGSGKSSAGNRPEADNPTQDEEKARN